ncbi:unnamed protein product, partial [marine sediment metagenome]
SLVQGNEPFELLNIFFTLSFGVMFLVNSLSLLPFLVVSMFVNFDFGLYGIVLIAFFVAPGKDKTVVP